jgi:hypothetical protein
MIQYFSALMKFEMQTFEAYQAKDFNKWLAHPWVEGALSATRKIAGNSGIRTEYHCTSVELTTANNLAAAVRKSLNRDNVDFAN